MFRRLGTDPVTREKMRSHESELSSICSDTSSSLHNVLNPKYIFRGLYENGMKTCEEVCEEAFEVEN